jgi:type II secretory pathway component PulJ
MRDSSRGAALLEVVVAVALLALAGVSWVGVLDGHMRAFAVLRDRERELADEERLLVAHALLTGENLDQRLGTRGAGPYIVWVQRPEQRLYRISIGRAAAPGVEDLVTVVRRDPAYAR